ncbi:hypothetical protein HER39_03450 [Arthrobacter deserti]|uniref:Uncharacterized protein n=1 Tax=Arthrobacter deserti TaxID=1742687 RepID=A0ABX1JJZ5_9MICC|nr:hypothetical protein [Arthrobacter deserti]
MDQNSPVQRQNVQRQLAIVEVARRARGRSMPEIKQMLMEAFARRRLPGPQGTWLDAVAAEASYGKAYIVDLVSARTARRVLPGGTGRTDGRRAGAGPDEGLAAVRAIVAGAVGLTLAVTAVMVIRAARRPPGP